MKNYFYTHDINLLLLDYFVKILDYNFIKNNNPQIGINKYEVELSFHISNFPDEEPNFFDYSLESTQNKNEVQSSIVIEKKQYASYYCRVFISKENEFSDFERLRIGFEDLQLQFINDSYSKKYIPKFLEKIEKIRKMKILNFINFVENSK